MAQRISTLFLTCLMLCVALCAPSLADDNRKQVLYLNSYQNGYVWSDSILSGIRSIFQDSSFTVDLQVEYMDAKKHPEADNRVILKRLFENKFRDTRFDAIICSDNAAFQFLLEHHEELFSSVPVIFCGVNDLQLESLKGHPGFTGIVEELDISANLDIALTLNPDKKQIVVVGDSSLSSMAIVAQIKEVMPDFADRLEFHFWNNLPLDELLTRSKTMPEDSFLFYMPFYVQSDGRYLSAGEVMEALYENANVPIYGAWSFLLGHGIVGGRLLDGETQGRVAAHMAVDILEGEPIPAERFETKVFSPLIFDWQVLDKFGLTDATFPEGATFINKPEPTYRLEKRVVWTVVILLCSLAAFTLFMVGSRNRAVKAEKELAVSRKMLRSIIDTVPHLVYWKDLNSKFIGANKRFADFFGLENPEAVTDKSNQDILKSKQISDKGESLDRQVASQDEPVLHEIVHYTNQDQKAVVFELNKVPLHDDMGQVSGVLTTAEDITERVELEQQLVQSKKLEAVGTFVGGIAHDFNNLLTTIINSAELALMDAKGVVAEDVNRAKSAAEHGSQLVRQILTYARPSNQGAVLTDPTLAVNDALDLIEHGLPTNISLVREVPGHGTLGIADPSHLRQIISNLCTNAIHAIGKDGGKLTVRLEILDSDEGKRELHLTISDNGPGIPEDITERIFDPFFTTKETCEGTGLGLAIVQGIVTGHGGAIKLTSRPGETTFDIRIPFPEGALEESNEHDKDVSGTEHILFVEDDPEQLTLIPRALEALGYTVSAAHHGQKALEIITTGQAFDIVVTDFDMPEMNGMELTRTINQLQPGLPVIIVSGGREVAAAAHGESGVAKIISKPYTGSALAAAIRQVLNHN